MGLTRKHFTVVFLCLCFTVFLLLISVSSSSSPQGQMETAASSLEHDNGVHCSRERSRAAWKIIDEYLMPFVEKERYKISSRCRLHPENDLYRDQEQHKMHVDINEWRCGYCKKTFYEEKYLDKHFDNRHYDLLNVSHSRCLADVCGALHCDLVLDSAPHKTRCNPAAIGRNKHLCESLADSCFPVSEGPSALHLNEFFLRQFCDAHTCSGEGDKHTACCNICSGFDASGTFLHLHVFVPEGNKKGLPRAEAHLKKWTEEKVLRTGAFFSNVLLVAVL